MGSVARIRGPGDWHEEKLRRCRDIMMDYVEGALEALEKLQFEKE